MAEVSTLKQRIEKAAERRAALVERKTRAEADEKAALTKLNELGLTPQTAEKAIADAQSGLEAAVAAVEKDLGLDS